MGALDADDVAVIVPVIVADIVAVAVIVVVIVADIVAVIEDVDVPEREADCDDVAEPLPLPVTLPDTELLPLGVAVRLPVGVELRL